MGISLLLLLLLLLLGDVIKVGRQTLLRPSPLFIWRHLLSLVPSP
jgi:hypothetical protein